MEFPVPAYTSFTIPTGATTGARITFNENGNGQILVYNSGNLLVDSIGGADGAIVSGNTLQLKQGNLYIGNAPSFPNAGSLGSFNSVFQGKIFLGSGTDSSAGSTQASFTAQFGAQGATTGASNAPNFSFYSSNTGTTAVDILLSGSLIKTDLTGIALTWQTPSYATGWQAQTFIQGVGGGHGIQFRKDVEDNVVINGLANCMANGNTVLFTLPVGYRPTRTQHINIGYETGGTFITKDLSITSSGVVTVAASTLAGDNLSINGVFPLGNLS